MAHPLVQAYVQAAIAGAIAEAEVLDKVEHTGTRGRCREVIVARLLRSLLPPSLHVCTGMLVDSYGGDSGQEDVIVYSPDLMPAALQMEEQTVVPIEAALAVVEVKSTLNAEEIKKAIGHARRAQALRPLLTSRQRVQGQFVRASPETVDAIRPEYCIFAFKSDLTGDLAAEKARILTIAKQETGKDAAEFELVAVAEKGAIFGRPGRGILAADRSEVSPPLSPSGSIAVALASLSDRCRDFRDARQRGFHVSSYRYFMDLPAEVDGGEVPGSGAR